jgi:catechol 2,3-dioxygenase-like lactoylglutathione lyase family enzyme
MVTMSQAIPAMPVTDATASVGFYRDRLGFEVLHHDGGFAVLRRDEAVVHLWEASDESWRERGSLERPVRSGAETFIAGTASCRIEVEGVDELYEELRGSDVFHPVSKAGVRHRLRLPGIRHARPRRQPGHVLSVGRNVSQTSNILPTTGQPGHGRGQSPAMAERAMP